MLRPFTVLSATAGGPPFPTRAVRVADPEEKETMKRHNAKNQKHVASTQLHCTLTKAWNLIPVHPPQEMHQNTIVFSQALNKVNGRDADTCFGYNVCIN